jgi:hypothetical protein
MGDRSDINLAGRALAQGWPISDATRAKLIDTMADVLGSAKSQRAKIAASKVILTASKQNLDGIRIERTVQGPAGSDISETDEATFKWVVLNAFYRLNNWALAVWAAIQYDGVPYDDDRGSPTESEIEDWVRRAATREPTFWERKSIFSYDGGEYTNTGFDGKKTRPAWRVHWDGLGPMCRGEGGVLHEHDCTPEEGNQ